MRTLIVTAILAVALVMGVVAYLAAPQMKVLHDPHAPASTARGLPEDPESGASMAREPDPQAAQQIEPLLERIAALEQRLEVLEARETALPASVSPPVLASRLDELELRVEVLAEEESSSPPAVAPERPLELIEAATISEEVIAEMDERVEAAVERKAEEIRIKQNKKPTLETFAEMLELEPYQVLAIENEVREGQRQLREILEIPTADGTHLVDELINVMAHGENGDPATGGLWMQWLGKVTSEVVPGTDQTYSSQIETVKSTVRVAFERELSEEQYTEFVDWNLDPTEIQEISESPWADLGERSSATAAQLKGQP